jgi:hypothetical protein
MSAHAPSGNSAPYKLLGVYGQPIETTIDFTLPNRRTEIIRCGDKWFSSLTTVTPVTSSTCRIDVIAAWNVFYHVPFVTPIAKFFGARFVRQDQVTMIQQAEGLRHNPSLMLIDDADKPAKWYFALKQARLDSAPAHREASHGRPGRAALAQLSPRPGAESAGHPPAVRLRKWFQRLSPIRHSVVGRSMNAGRLILTDPPG